MEEDLIPFSVIRGLFTHMMKDLPTKSEQFRYLTFLFWAAHSGRYPKKENKNIIKHNGKFYPTFSTLENVAKYDLPLRFSRSTAIEQFDILREKKWIVVRPHKKKSYNGYRLTESGIDEFLNQLLFNVKGHRSTIEKMNNEKLLSDYDIQLTRLENYLYGKPEKSKDKNLRKTGASFKPKRIKISTENSKAFSYRINSPDFKLRLQKIKNIEDLIPLGEAIGNLNFKDSDGKRFCALISLSFQILKGFFKPKNSFVIANDRSRESIENFFIDLLEPPEFSSFDAYIPNHQLVSKIRSLIVELLEYESNGEIIPNFLYEFNTNIDKKASENGIIKEYLMTPDNIKPRRELIEYLEYLKTLIFKSNPLDGICVKKYYIENYACKYPTVLHLFENVNEKKQISVSYEKSYELVTKVIDDSLGEKPYTIIAAPFGVGKTSLVHHLAYKFASEYLDHLYVEGVENEYYFPIFIYLKDGLKVETYNGKNPDLTKKLGNLLPQDPEKKRKIVVICDGLDDYVDRNKEYNTKQMNGLIETLDSLINDENYSNVKIIITTRPASISREIIDMQANGIEIIPFNGDQVTKFFKSYGLPEEYNFDNIKNFQLSSEIICTPLFCWMFAYIVMTSGQNRLFDYDLSKNVLTTKLYQKFFYSIIRGKLMAKEYHNWLQQFLEEKKILRRVAALWYLKYPDLVDSYLIKGLIALGMEELGSDTETERKEKLKLIEPFITAYFYRLGKYRPEKKIDFMHKSFGEFLLAEFFIESFITNRKYYLEITIPNEETINYFEGLLNLLNDENIVTHKNGQPDNMQLFLDSVPSPASDSMQVEGLHHRGIVVENAEKFFKEDSIILRIDKNKYKEINDYKNNANVDLHWEIAEITSYPRLYVHRWLSVFLLNILSPEKLTDDTEKKQKLVDLIKLTSRLMPNYLLRLSQVNLSQTEEFRADLSGADLSNANLSQAKLFYANLYDAKLSGADLHDVKLIHADLHDADLSGADLHDAELIHADLHDADLSSADLSNADLSSADLSNADLHYANLSGAKFINTDLSNADLYDADLSGANFFNAKNLPISSEEIRNRGGIFDS